MEQWEIDLAKRAYEGYCNYTDGKSLVTGDKLPSWDDLKPEIKNAWHSAAMAVYEVSV